MIIKCTCSNSFQDNLYGEGKRVMNPTVKDNIYRCTICTNTVSYGAPKEEKKKKGKK